MTDESSVRTPKALPDGVSQATVGVRGGCCGRGSKRPPRRCT